MTRPGRARRRHAQRMTMARQRLGAAAEEIAAQRLAGAGWQIVARNERTRFGEIDIIAVAGRTLVFVEVKASRTGRCRGPERPALAVGPQKRRRIRRLARAWFADRPRMPRYEEVRFDVIGIEFGPGDRIADYEHIEAAF